MELLFYPLDLDYEIREEGPAIYLYGKTTDGRQVCVVDFFQPYFYVEVDPQRDVRALLNQIEVRQGETVYRVVGVEEVEKTIVKQKKLFYKVFVPLPKAVPLVKERAAALGLQCYEYDILFVYRYLIDKQIVPMTLVKAEGNFVEEKRRVPTFIAEKIVPLGGETLNDVKILALDIETYAKEKIIDMEKNPILMVAFYGQYRGKELKKVITWKRFLTEGFDVEFVDGEKALIERCTEVIRHYQPDILTGYYSDGFDLPYVSTRARKYGLTFDVGWDYSSIVVGQKESKIAGLVHVDVFKFVRTILWRGLQTSVYTLDAVANELLGFGKYAVDLNRLAEVWDTGSDELQVFCHYNLQDAYATFKLAEKLLFDMVEFAKLVGIPLFGVTRMSFSKLVEYYLLRRAVEFDIVAPNKPEYGTASERFDQHFTGAFVYQPEPGLYSDLVVFDFRSLYPTIISSHNIGPETVNCVCCAETAPRVPEIGHWFCQKTKGFLSTVVEDLIVRRMRIKEMIKQVKAEGGDLSLLNARSEALKIMTNSFYGYLGFFAARWYSLPCAESVTAYARSYIQRVIAEATEQGFSVVYSDTDSIFITLQQKQKEDALAFVQKFNQSLTGYMELDYQGYYPRGIFVAVKGEEKGAKKKYALLNTDGTVKVTGFESVRRNWSPIAKEVQEQVLSLVLNTSDASAAIDYVRQVIDDLRKMNVEVRKTIITTQLQKPIAQYESVGPHVAIAQQLQNRGEVVGSGTVIRYVVVKGKGMIRERVKLPEDVRGNEYDPDYYVHHQILPAVSGILGVFGYTAADIVQEKSQSKLGEFF